jgi:hypothetical protein
MSIINEALRKAHETKGPQEKPGIFSHERDSKKVALDRAAAKVGMRNISKEARPVNWFAYIVILVIVVGGVAFFMNQFYFKTAQEIPIPKMPAKEGMDSAIYEKKPIPAETADLPQESLLPQLALSGIVYDVEKPYAIVNNKVLVQGDKIDGAVVVEISRDRVKFVFQDEEFEISSY